jgi:hypothetical protein
MKSCQNGSKRRLLQFLHPATLSLLERLATYSAITEIENKIGNELTAGFSFVVNCALKCRGMILREPRRFDPCLHLLVQVNQRIIVQIVSMPLGDDFDGAGGHFYWRLMVNRVGGTGIPRCLIFQALP